MIKDNMNRSLFNEGRGNLGERPGFTYFIDPGPDVKFGRDECLFFDISVNTNYHFAHQSVSDAYNFYKKLQRIGISSTCTSSEVWTTVYNSCVLGQAYTCAMIQANVGVNRYDCDTWMCIIPTYKQYTKMLAKCIRRHMKAGANFGFDVMDILHYCEAEH